MTNKEWVTPPGGLKLKWKGVLDLNELYKQMKIWLEDKGFFDDVSSEKRYDDTRFAGGVKNLSITWNTKKPASNYFTHHINVAFLIIGMSDVEVQLPNGAKEKMKKGSFEIKIVGYVQTGSKEWDKLGPFEKIYYNLIIRKRLDTALNDLYGKVYKFQAMIKNFFIKGENIT